MTTNQEQGSLLDRLQAGLDDLRQQPGDVANKGAALLQEIRKGRSLLSAIDDEPERLKQHEVLTDFEAAIDERLAAMELLDN